MITGSGSGGSPHAGWPDYRGSSHGRVGSDKTNRSLRHGICPSCMTDRVEPLLDDDA